MTETTAKRPSALLVVDVQNDVVENGYDRDGVVSRIAGLIEKAKAEDVPVIWVQHHDEQLERGSDGWQIVEDIRPGTDDIVVEKQFNDSFADTSLADTLQRLGIGHLVVTGAASDWCVRATATRALVEGYDMTLVEDAHTTKDNEFDLTDGEKVPIAAKQVIAHTNMNFCWLSYPGVTTTITPAAQVEFIR